MCDANDALRREVPRLCGGEGRRCGGGCAEERAPRKPHRQRRCNACEWPRRRLAANGCQIVFLRDFPRWYHTAFERRCETTGASGSHALGREGWKHHARHVEHGTSATPGYSMARSRSVLASARSRAAPRRHFFLDQSPLRAAADRRPLDLLDQVRPCAEFFGKVLAPTGGGGSATCANPGPSSRTSEGACDTPCKTIPEPARGGERQHALASPPPTRQRTGDSGAQIFTRRRRGHSSPRGLRVDDGGNGREAQLSSKRCQSLACAEFRDGQNWSASAVNGRRSCGARASSAIRRPRRRADRRRPRQARTQAPALRCRPRHARRGRRRLRTDP